MSPRRITIVASELLGRAGTGGAGTADSLLAVALGRRGHEVRLVVASGRHIGALSPEWVARYDAAGVEISVLERSGSVRPPYLARSFEILQALSDSPPDVAIVDDWRGLGFVPLRARQTGTALAETALIVHCHGPGRVLTEFAQKVPDTVDRFAEDVMEQTSIALADAVVSPSEWLLGWMRAHGWPVPPSADVIQYVRQSAALDEEPSPAPKGGPIRRLAFFGQLREGKGIRIYLEALALLPTELLDRTELLFLGSGRGRWTRDRIAAALPAGARAARFETELERDTALTELQVAGTLAVMPSLLDNSPNTVAECIERGIPFVATETGGIPELVADEDRARVLCPPTAAALSAALHEALTSPDGVAPAHAAHDARRSVDRWLELVETVAPAKPRRARPATNVAIVASGEQSAGRAQGLAAATRTAAVEVVVAESRREGLGRTAADWVVFLDDDDDPDEALVDAFVAAQAASGADVVTAAAQVDDGTATLLFLGDPGPLGLLENQYGVIGFVRSEHVAAQPLDQHAGDPDWPLFARVALAGGRVVSIPQALSRLSGRPGRAGVVPGEGLAVLEGFEEHRAAVARMLPQFAATLAAALERATTSPPASDGSVAPLSRRLRRRLALLARPRHSA